MKVDRLNRQLAWGDFFLLNLSFLIGYGVRFGTIFNFTDGDFPLFLMIFNLLWLVLASFLKTYRSNKLTDVETVVRSLLQLLVIHFLVTAALNGFLKTFYSRLFLTYTYGSLSLLLFLGRLAFIVFRKRWHRSGRGFYKVIVVGYTAETKEVISILQTQPEHGMKLMALFDDRHPGANGKFEEFKAFCAENQVDEIFCSLSGLKKSQVKSLIDYCDHHLIRLRLVPEYKGFEYAQSKVGFIGHVPVFFLRSIPLDIPLNRLLKRIFDIVFSLLVIVLILSWLIPILAIWIRIDSKGPIFFQQKRSGLNNEDFWCYKLRSMTVNTESDKKQAERGDIRITKVGAFLRKTSLDELPQFFNVLLGEMSVVGPRPHMVAHTEQYSQIIDKYMVRHLVKPGVTGLSQVKGYRGETKDPRMMRNRVKIDLFYLEHWTFLLDLKVVFLTVWNVVKGEANAH